MGFIEKISPKWAYKREAWRQANEIQKRNYDAGMYDRQNRNWFAHNECSKIHTESMIHYLEDYMYCTRKLGLYVQLVA